MLMPLLAAISPTVLIIVAVSVVVALALIVAGTLSARSAAHLPKAPPAAKALEPKLERLAPELSPPPQEKAPKAPAPAPLTAEEREQQATLKKEAYWQKKEAEAQERERRRQEEQDTADRAAEEARQRAEEEERRASEARAEEARKVQAQAGKTLADGLAKTRGGFMSRLNGLLSGGRANANLDDQLLAQLEEVLFSADIGVKTASQLLEVARSKLKRGDLSDPEAVKTAIRAEIERILETAQGETAQGAGAAKPSPGAPEVWMIVGVNGAGKTTTIGKLAAQLTRRGEKVVLGAADTFRAAATDQLAIWAQRAGAELVKGPEGGDPGSVAFEAVKRGQALGATHVLIDTAGRLHTKAPLMEELKKVKRVLQKAEPGAPHQILLVLDSTNGQNAIAQARQFHETLEVTALALTKLDGTAKGGVLIGIADELKLPVRYIGVGETVEDLQPFEAHAFVEALFG